MTSRLVEVFTGVARTMRAILGAPDYERYVAHIRECHPDRSPISRDDFYQERLDARYAKAGSRCC